MEEEKRDIERDAGQPLESRTDREKEESIEEAGFEPIRGRRTDGGPLQKEITRSSRALSRSRSNNGFGVDDVPADEEDSSDNAANPPPVEKDPYEVSFEGGDLDPMCPRHRSAWSKWLIVAIAASGSFCVTCASSIYTSTYTQMDAEFGNSRIVATLGLSTFVLGIALGPFWSPLAEFYGRRPIYLVSFAAYTIWIIPSAVAKNIQTMIIARFFQGLSGAAFLSVSGGTVGDLFTKREIHLPMALFTLAPFTGPSIGPLIGGFINTYADWRWTHYVLIIWGFVLFLALLFFVPETYHPIVLKAKAKKLRKDTGDDRWHAPIEKSTKSFRATAFMALTRPFLLLRYEVMCVILDLYSAILLGILYLFFGAFPLVFINNHGFNLWQVGLTFLGIFVGMLLGAFCTPFFHKIHDGLAERRRKATGDGSSEPEDQLPSVIVGGPLISIGLFWFAWTVYPSVHWIVPIIGSGIFAIGVFLAFSGIFTFLVDAYPLYAASTLAANAFVRCISAGAFPLFGVQMYEKLGYEWATTLLAFLTVAMIPFPFLFFRYGKKIRERSKFASA